MCLKLGPSAYCRALLRKSIRFGILRLSTRWWVGGGMEKKLINSIEIEIVQLIQLNPTLSFDNLCTCSSCLFRARADMAGQI